MRFTDRSLGLLVVATTIALTASDAHADGFASVTTLDASARARLEASITTARSHEPQAFDTVRAIVARADDLDHQKRGRFYPMAALLRGSTRGRQAAMALLEPIVSPERFTMPHVESARIALRAGLIEAAGDQKEQVAAPVFRAIVQSSNEFYEVRAAAEALGKLGLDSDVATLAQLASTAGPKQEAVIAGLGDCRRTPAAHALEAVVGSKPTGMLAKRLARALGAMGAAWTLAIPNAAPPLEVPTIRDTTARAALALFVSATEADVRQDASNALVVIAAPDTPSWIARARASVSPALALELDTLQTRLAHNPTTRRTP